MKLLTIGNTKTMKGENKGYLTGIMHFAPANLSGFNVCPMASEGCRAACLNTAGRGRFSSIQASRIRKTQWFFRDRQAFMLQLVKDVQALARKASREGLTPVVRLNGTSDIRWEHVPVMGFQNIMEYFPNIQFYDYTKLQNRKNIPSNYHLTFSYDERQHAAPQGMNIAMVFDYLPDTWNNKVVIDGTADDLRFLDPENVIVGLEAKGKAKQDVTGFVTLTKVA